ncbi:MAG: leucine-rich repeat protein [Ruminococcus sp.]|nr:leucine-rich repeat protein [Ruminococcus sp.]
MDAKGFELLMAAKILGGGGSPIPPEPPADGKTRLYITLAEGRLSPVLGLGVNGLVDVDWGDGTAHGTLTGTDISTLVTIPHTYARAGKYIIVLTPTSDSTATIIGSETAPSGSLLFTKNGVADTDSRVYMSSLNRVYISANVVEISDSAFRNCFNLSTVVFQNGITTIPKNAFYNCYSLDTVIIPNSVTTIGANAFYNCYSIESISLPNSVTSIGSSAFYGCVSLNSIDVPNGVGSIAFGTFASCVALINAGIPDSVTIIGEKAFQNCVSLTNIIVPDKVTSIGPGAFVVCMGMGSIKFDSLIPPTASSSATFGNISEDCIIYIPQGTLEAYTSATNYPDPDLYSYIEY